MLANPVLSLQHLSKYYDLKSGEILVFKDIDLDIYEREFLCILGPTGSGKSTLLKVIGGIEKQTLGTIILNGESFEEGIPPDKLEKFGFMFQQDNLLAWRTVAKNLELPLEIFRKRTKASGERIDHMLQLVGLLDYKRVYPHELSGGMRQRVSLARAMMHDPEIFLMDQPLGALDAITRKMLAYELLNISRKTQKVMVMVTNNVDEALLLSNRIVIFSSLPGTILRIIDNDIPADARNEQMAEHHRYKALREELEVLIRVQNSEGG